ncbi:MAG: DedA family protein [Candidatus Brockarchaeota archaeon]|nr:DedA family protein [Candidatus Brockarchaeota archaeon]
MNGIVEFLNDLLIEWISKFGFPGIVAATALEIVVMPIPGEIVMPYVGYVAWLSGIGPGGLTMFALAGTFGNVLGSSAIYAVGRKGGRAFVSKYGKHFVSEKNLAKTEDFFKKHGGVAVLIGRVLPGFRTIVSLPAGFFRMRLAPFLAYTSAGSFLWNLGLAYAGYSLGPYWYTILRYSQILDVAAVTAFLILLLYLVVNHRRKTRKG